MGSEELRVPVLPEESVVKAKNVDAAVREYVRQILRKNKGPERQQSLHFCNVREHENFQCSMARIVATFPTCDTSTVMNKLQRHVRLGVTSRACSLQFMMARLFGCRRLWEERKKQGFAILPQGRVKGSMSPTEAAEVWFCTCNHHNMCSCCPCNHACPRSCIMLMCIPSDYDVLHAHMQAVSQMAKSVTETKQGANANNAAPPPPQPMPDAHAPECKAPQPPSTAFNIRAWLHSWLGPDFEERQRERLRVAEQREAEMWEERRKKERELQAAEIRREEEAYKRFLAECAARVAAPSKKPRR